MNIVCLDMEGVLVPEIWIAFSETSGIPEIEADFQATLAKCRQADRQDKEKWGLRLMGFVLKTIAPLL